MKTLDTTKPEPLLDRIARGSAPGLAVSVIAAAFGIALAIGDAAGAANSSPALTRIATIGERIFKDSGLSASGRLACSTCHVADSGHAVSNDASVPLGGPNGDIQGFRNAPSLRYLNTNRAFTFDKEGTPTGGFNSDGRAASLMRGVVQKVRFLGNTGANVPRQIEGDNSVETAETGMGGTPSHDALRRERSAGNRGAQASGGAFPRSSILWDSCRFVRRSGCA